MSSIPFLLGCIADDFTGASDAASFLVNNDIPTMLYNGVPQDSGSLQNCAAVVIALKTRNAPTDEAVRDTLDAFSFVEKRGAKQFYIKYCSTFDSTPKGNIGPTVDAVLDKYDIPYTVLCPALPVNKRIVKDGYLYVDGVPLSDSHMRNHPLNPMWDSDLAKLMEPQGKYVSLVLNAEEMKRSAQELVSLAENGAQKNTRLYIIPDYADDGDGRRIVEIFGGLRLITGGSGLLAPLAERYRAEHGFVGVSAIDSKCPGKGIALSGSCSEATKGQIKEYRDSGHAVLAVDPGKLLDGSQTVENIWEFVCQHNEPLIHSALRSGNETEQASALLEKTFSEIGRRAFENGYSRIIVAGGETSGAVTLALGFDSFHIGESIAPGVPVMVPAGHQNVRVVLKSGNFGQPDFFRRALDQTRGSAW
ncbi:MAG: four-carbon acid sugar kinase family protein [Defluviitaleaceae bacterium]|nr:four-carbon acid sugar kinase family protein [Defluviitaleaceae bacterium]